jgi:hypothetical protein
MYITTYEEYMKVSQIKEVVICGKIGYLRFEDSLWFRFNTMPSKSPGCETLEGFLSHNTKTKFPDIVYNFSKIREDMKVKCLQEKPREYKLKYHEYLIGLDDARFKILDASKFEFYDINKDRFVTEDDAIHRTWLVDSNIAPLPDFIYSQELCSQGFKDLCRSIFIKPSKNVIIFRDKWNLAYFIEDVMYMLTRKFQTDRYIIIDSEDKINEVKGCKNILIRDKKCKFSYYYTYDFRLSLLKWISEESNGI